MTTNNDAHTNFAYQHNKKTGATYVYSVLSYWDKEKKAPRNKQAYLGKLDPNTGEIIPSARRKPRQKTPGIPADITATTEVAGPCMVLDKIAEETGVANLLKKCFPELSEEMLSLVYFLVQKGLPLSRSEQWSGTHKHPYKQVITSQRISDLLQEINENDCQRFMSLWMKKAIQNDYLCYDITSISSYSRGNEYVRYGYNRDGEALPQINFAMLFGQKSGLPAYCRRMQGNISDVATLKTTMKAMGFLGAKRVHFVLDRGFYSKTNIDEMLERRHHFTMAVPAGRKWVETIIDGHYDSVSSPSNYHEINDNEALFAKTVLYKWGEKNRRTYLHIYFNAARAAEEYDRFTRHLLKVKRELESGDISQADGERYSRYFFVHETPKRGKTITFNDEEIQKHRNIYAGFFCILSTVIKDPIEALHTYRTREVVESGFDDMKNQLDMKRLRIHSSSAMDARIFLQFLALIFICRIRNTIRPNRKLRNYTIREIMELMETLVQIKYSGKYGQLYTETGPTQRKILDAFGVDLVT
jgi:transposase